jgi:hypothetical protein
LSQVRAVSILAFAVALLALPASAGATIVPQQSIAGVHLQMTTAQVRAKLGAPPKVLNGKNDFGPYTTFVYPRVTISFQGRKRVSSLRTTSARERTAAGVGVGSTEGKVKAGVPRVKCKTELGSRQCVVGLFKPGHVVTAFLMKSGKVRAVVVGIVLD